MIDYTGKDQSWWPDMTGRTVAILASGPSMTRAQCDMVRGTEWISIAINETWLIARWATILYGCDWQWWKSKAPLGADFDGLRVCGTIPTVEGSKKFPPEMKWQADLLRYLPVRAGLHQPLWKGSAVAAGSNSAFQVANWAARCGAKRLVLLGVDCHSPNAHWHGGHTHKEATDQKPQLMNTWIMAWRNAAPEYDKRGIRVINCSPGSALKCFKTASLKELAA